MYIFWEEMEEEEKKAMKTVKGCRNADENCGESEQRNGKFSVEMQWKRNYKKEGNNIVSIVYII